MNVLWISNIVPPEAEALLGNNRELKSTGGWIVGLADVLSKQEHIHLSIAAISPSVDGVKVLTGERITYYLIPQVGDDIHYTKQEEPLWKTVKQLCAPDVVHIHGTESPHALSFVKACGSENVVVSIQGLVSAYYYYYYYGQTFFEVFSNITLRDIIRGGTLIGKRRFVQRAKSEVDLLKKVHHIIGRTDWDRCKVWSLNPSACYHFNNETLRKEFYQGDRWSLESCERYSIFVSQGAVPYKGLHQVLKALPLILRDFPQSKVYVAGYDICRRNTLKEKLLMTGYGKYLSSVIKKFGLEGKVIFTGPLSAQEMKKHYLSSNVFVSPSAIENSPNSVGEAQILGVPVISSFVGGVVNMIPDSSCGKLYRFEEIEMLANMICDIFTNSKVPSERMIAMAKERHDGERNVSQLLNIYKKVASK